MVSLEIIHNVAVSSLPEDFEEDTYVNIGLGENLRRKHYRAKLCAVLTYDCYCAKRSNIVALMLPKHYGMPHKDFK